MNMFNKLPRFVWINNEKYFIRTDFRIFIEFEKGMQGKNVKKVVYETLSKFYPAFFKILQKDLFNEAVDKFIWFYKCGKEDVEIKSKNKSNKKTRIYDYDYDSDLIWGAYFSQFKVDLSNVSLHWWKFRAMWNSLSNECEFSKIRGYRVYDGKDTDLLELKEQHKLPPTEFEVDEQKRHQEIFEKLKNIETSQQ